MLFTKEIAQDKCTFCEIANRVRKENEYIISEDEDVVAFLAHEPVLAAEQSTSVRLAKGHTLVAPKKHYVNIFDVDQDVLSKVMSVTKAISRSIRDNLKVDGVLIYLSNGEASGQEIFHLHAHVIPRTLNDGIRAIGPTFRLSQAELRTLAQGLSQDST